MTTKNLINYYDYLLVDNVKFIGGEVNAGAVAGVIAAYVYIGKIATTNPVLSINNVYSSTMVSGYYSAGLFGLIEDFYENEF